MRQLGAAAALVLLSAAAGCTEAPLCRYWSDAPIGKGVLDPSAVPMLPDNPYWTGEDRAAAPTSPGDPCAGEPGHPGHAPG